MEFSSRKIYEINRRLPDGPRRLRSQRPDRCDPDLAAEEL